MPNGAPNHLRAYLYKLLKIGRGLKNMVKKINDNHYIKPVKK